LVAFAHKTDLTHEFMKAERPAEFDDLLGNIHNWAIPGVAVHEKVKLMQSDGVQTETLVQNACRHVTNAE
jgi:hypothetical protein